MSLLIVFLSGNHRVSEPSILEEQLAVGLSVLRTAPSSARSISVCQQGRRGQKHLKAPARTPGQLRETLTGLTRLGSEEPAEGETLL